MIILSSCRDSALAGIVLLSTCWFSCSSTPTAPPAEQVTAKKELTELRFSVDSFDFGTLVEGEVAKHVFQVHNVGKAPLIIDEVIATCGCTVPSYTKTPIAPGKSGEVAISFNSQGRVGVVNKNVFVKSNAQSEMLPLNFKAIVVAQ